MYGGMYGSRGVCVDSRSRLVRRFYRVCIASVRYGTLRASGGLGKVRLTHFFLADSLSSLVAVDLLGLKSIERVMPRSEVKPTV